MAKIAYRTELNVHVDTIVNLLLKNIKDKLKTNETIDSEILAEFIYVLYE